MCYKTYILFFFRTTRSAVNRF